MKREEEEKYTQAKAKKIGLQYVNLVGYPIIYDVLKIISSEDSRKHNAVSYLKTGSVIKVATTNPINEDLKQYINKISQDQGIRVVLVLCSPTSLRYSQTLYTTQLKKQKISSKVEVGSKQQDDFTSKIQNLSDLKDKISQVPATEVIELIFAGAVKSEASDVHLEPEENSLRIRYRIDGVLQDVIKLPKEVEKIINSRVKYLSKLKLDIKNKPQDGRFDISTAGMAIDIRVSILPSAYGETIVMRLLPKDKKFITLEELGFRPEYIEIIKKQIAKPNGIVFNTGPTGSGKTTTNYAILSKINNPQVKIVTLEDPIEYKIEGIDQSQVQEDRGYTFATGLRSILRQDPDIIMVGEVRDEETATISMQAAMTGHLVLTTLHTNSASGAIPRLLDMGVKPYLLGGSINLIIAQRLIRKIHQACTGKGCIECNNTGYKGRIAIAELLVPNKKIEDLIVRHGSLADFENQAIESGMMTIYEDGMDKVKQGLTTKEEVLRVTQQI
jgi:type II secretory ATPase GspE/PulE/Tfp pilus assembly ATPase PilB-like protein